MNQPTPRKTDERNSGGLNPLATLPVFFKLAEKRVIVAGGSDAAAWKAELLAACGAFTFVFAAEPGEKMRVIVEANPRVRLFERRWGADDLNAAALAIADLEDAQEIAAFRAAARAASVPINVIDKPRDSDFQFGAIVERSPLVIGISTDGGAPVFAQALRARIETLLPQGFRGWAAAAKEWRAEIAAKRLDFRARRRVWEIFARRALGEPQRAPDPSDLLAMLNEAESGPAPPTGSVFLVGAGPGDPELLTLRAVRALQSADVVLYDDLVSPGVVDMARREALRLSVGKRGYKPSCTQEDIIAMLIEHARAGRNVVRLKGGDPMVFGRAGEEIDALEKLDIPVQVIPGITAASAASATLRRSLTERQRARRLQFITAHARDGKLPEDLDWKALVDPGATSVIYMGVRTLKVLAERLMAEGLPPDTPAAIVQRSSWPDERHLVSTIAKLADDAAEQDFGAPSLIIVGSILRRAE